MNVISVIIGSTREGRFSEKPAKWILQHLKKRKGVDARLLDLRDYPMPFFDRPLTPAMPGRPPCSRTRSTGSIPSGIANLEPADRPAERAGLAPQPPPRGGGNAHHAARGHRVAAAARGNTEGEPL